MEESQLDFTETFVPLADGLEQSEADPAGWIRVFQGCRIE